MKSGIYIIKNKINDKVYIGSSVNIPIRKYSHFYQLRNNRHHNNHLQRFYNIHGKENFVFEILKECREEDLLSWEQHYLDLYKDKFNQCEFAGHTLNRIFSEETKRKISNALKGKLKGIPKNEETKLKMRHPKSVEHAYKIKLAQEYTRKIVYQYNFKLELITIFNSVIEASRQTGLKRSEISACCNRRKQKTAKGFLFTFKKLDNADELFYNRVIERTKHYRNQYSGRD